MRCVDVNVLVYAHRPESPDHERYRTWLEQVRRDDEPLALSLAIAVDFVEALRSSPNAVSIGPGERHWDIFTELCREIGARGDDVPDAFHAAIAVENGATWFSADRGFARFRSLRWTHPLDAGA
jgi:predicted nucleic acid-binding protein